MRASMNVLDFVLRIFHGGLVPSRWTAALLLLLLLWLQASSSSGQVFG